MKQFFTLTFSLFLVTVIEAQKTSYKHDQPVNFDGQWKGGFNETTYRLSGFGSDDIVYVLELTTDGSRVSGYSYTYFTEGHKKYYTICRLTGSLNRDTKDLVVTEIERTKFNTPPDFINCFQTHRLHYEKDSDDIEVLRGTWTPAPNQGQGCGSGTTVLSRRVVNRPPVDIVSSKKELLAKTSAKKPGAKNHVAATPKKVTSHTKSIAIRPQTQKNKTVKNDTFIVNQPTKPEIKNSTILSVPKYESRRKDIVKTIRIEQPTFQLDFYDNGEIDGDSISVFYNGKLVLSHQKLTGKPISLTLALNKNVKENLVTMYADNLGTIPPNTAIMIVTDGAKRYEVRIESDLAKSGSVIFKSE